jgi:DNA-binding winged helix-turn-helix (wHTH) protein/predicted ATPase
MDTYELGPFLLDAGKGVLLRGSERVALGQRATALLQALVAKPGALVSKDVLIEAAWPGQAVEESNLTVQIAALRRALGSAPGGERWIETMPRRGYRFAGPVVVREENSVTAAREVDPPRDAVPDWHGQPERRQITALSCELTGLEAGADGTGLEELHEIVGDFRSCVSETAARHAGVIYRQFGSHLHVLFGYPEAHEHDAEQAIRAGLALCAAMRCRVGIATGMVIIGETVSDGAPRDREIVGDIPNLAARLLASARPDTVVIDRVTRRLIGNLFACRDLGAVETNSDTDPTRRWQVLRESVLASRFEALRGSKLTRLVGRDEEIDLLLRRWARAKGGAGQIILVSGEAGLGKSRIAEAFEERLLGEPHLRLRYFCSPYHQDSALFPIIDQLGRAAGFARADLPDAKQEKLAALLARVKPPVDDVALVADLMSLPASARHPLPALSPQRKKERTLQALIRQLEGLAHENPVVMVLEDAQWLDPTTLELLDLTVEGVRRLPVLLIVTFRPEFQPPWTGQPQVTMLELNRLDHRDRTALVAQVAGSKTLPDDAVAQIAERTDGVPLFVEELTKSVLESGLLSEEHDRFVLDRALPPLAIPMTLHASLLARLDRLASMRPVAQVGAAIGRQFPYTLLRAVCRLPEDELQTALGRLVASELVFQRGRPPDAIYSFKHALVQDTAYGSLLRYARQQLHARIAAALETDSPEAIESQPELLAQHYAEAGLIEKSVAYWGKAGRRSAARSAMTEAAAQLQKGLDQLALLPDTLERQRHELEFLSALGPVFQAVRGFAAVETGQIYTRARDLWEQLNCPLEFLHIPYGQSRSYLYRGELDLALRSDESLLRLSRKRNDPAGLVVGHGSSGQSLLAAGRFGSCRTHYKEALLLYDPICRHTLIHQAGIHVNLTGGLGIALFCLGYPDQASAQCSAAIAEARKLAHAVSLAGSLAADAFRQSLAGENAALIERADELVAVTTERGFPLWGALGALYRGWGKIKLAEVAEGMSLIRHGLATYRATGTKLWMPYFITLLANTCEIAGHIEEAATLVDEALRIIERTGERWFEAELHRHRGRLLLRQRYAGAAEKLYRKALSIAQEQEAKMWELRSAMSLARLWGEQGRQADAHALLAAVYGWFTEGFSTADLKAAKILLDDLK